MAEPKTKTLLVPVDLHDELPRWLDYAVELASGLGAELLLLHVVDYLPMVMPVELPAGYPLPQVDVVKEAATGKLAALAKGITAVPVRTVVDVGAAAATIVDVARQHSVDQIVLGSHARHGIARMVLGSVAERVARTANCPVTIVPMDRTA